MPVTSPELGISADTRVGRKRSEVAPHPAVPLQPGDRPLPSALHLPQRHLMVGVATGDCLPEVTVLRLDDLVRVLAMRLQATRPTALSARHGLHLRPFLRRLDSKLRVTLLFREF